jgi:hypothetical protein
VVLPHALWLNSARDLVMSGLDDSVAVSGRLSPALWLCLVLLTTHLGLALMVGFASGWPRRRNDRAPEIERNPAEPWARSFVYFFALMPAACAIAIAFAGGRLGPLERIAPLVVLSGLAVVLAAGDRIMLYRERLVSLTWLGLLVAPPALVVLGLIALPWMSSAELKIAQPARVEGQFFAENFQRRTGKPLNYVAGDARLAPLIALNAPSRPHVYFDWAPQRSPWASPADFAKEGGLLAWPVADNTGAPPANLKTQFPALVPEVPRAFARPIQGLLPLVRVGWAMLRPQP